MRDMYNGVDQFERKSNMEENLEKDQVQKDSPKEEAKVETKGPRVIKKDQAPKEQSEKTSGEEEKPKLYKLPDGREVTADDLYKEHTENLLPEFTRRSQKLAEIERKEAETQERNKRTAEQSVSQNKLLEDVDPNVREAIVQIVSPVIQEALKAKDKEIEKARSQEAFDKRLLELEKKYPGGDGMKKFDRLEILREMQKPTNEIYDPEVLYQRLHWDSFLDAQIKAAMKGKSGSVKTEDTSTEAPKKPGETKSPTTWSKASENAFHRI